MTSRVSFVRVAWTSDKAREVWEPRMARIRTAWLETERASVADGIRPCAVQTRDDERTVIGAPDIVAEFHKALGEERDDRVGELLGYPACCRAFFRAVWIGAGQTDTTWPMARASADAARDTPLIEATAHPAANMLWRQIGIRAVPHLPCCFHCRPTIDLGRQLLDVGARNGYEPEWQWLQAILSWPVEWSALHGIAEIKTPILKISASTDRLTGKRVVRLRGSGFPAEGARGLHFPYQQPRKLTRLSMYRRNSDVEDQLSRRAR